MSTAGVYTVKCQNYYWIINCAGSVA
jgi:hypothetical protein